MANEDKRIIELPASTSILNDDWIAKDSASQDTTRLQLSFLKQLCGGNNFAGEWHSGTVYNKEAYVTHEGKLYHNIKGGSVVAVDWSSSQWEQVSIGNELRKIVESLAPTFDTSTNYKVDDLVIYDNTLYRCIVAHTAGTWVSSHFATVKVSSLLLSSIMDNFTDIYWEDYSGSPVNYTKGTVIHKGFNLYRCKADTTNQSWDSSKWEQVDVTDLLATEHGYIQSLISIIAPTFSSLAQYNINDFVIYNNELYICMKPHHGRWDPLDFGTGKIGDMLKGIFNNIADVYNPSGSYVKGDVVNYVGIPLRCIVDTATSPMVFSEWERVTVEQLIDEKVSDVQIAGQTTTDEDKISDLTSLAIEGTASGEIASFSDGSNLPMRSFICNIDAVQDLHGYDAPWVGGAGKNKLNYEAWKTVSVYHGTAVFENNGITLTATDNDCYTSYSKNLPTDAIIKVTQGDVVRMSWEETSNLSGIVMLFAGETLRAVVNNNTVKTLSYTVQSGVTELTFRFGVQNSGNTIEYKNIMITINNQDTTWSPYSNICPISGHTGVDAWVRGKNLLDEPSFKDLSKWKSDLFPYGDYPTDNVNKGFLLNTIPNKTYSISFGFTADTTPNHTYLYLCRANGNNNERVEYLTGASYHTNHVTFTTEKGYIYYLRVNVFNASSFVPNMTFAQLELGSTATAYEPYNPDSQTIQVSWQTEAGEVYGGYVDLVSGVLTVDKTSITFNGTENWSYSATNNRVYRYISSNAKAPSGTDKGFIQSDKLHYSGDEIEEYGAFISSSKNLVVYAPSSITSGEQWATWLTSNNIQVVYELATSITYQLTPTQIKSLLGTNNAWCDTGDVNIKYNKDATTVINSLIARIEALENA